MAPTVKYPPPQFGVFPRCFSQKRIGAAHWRSFSAKLAGPLGRRHGTRIGMSGKWRKRLCIWGLASGFLAGLWLLRAPLLRGAAWPLVAEEPFGAATAVCIDPDCDGVFDVAAALARQQPPRRVLLVAPLPLRVAEMGLVPRWEEICRRELAARGVSGQAFVVVGPPTQDAWQHAQRLAGWLSDNPGQELVVLCDRFDSGRRRAILHRVLGPEAHRVRVRGLPRWTYDETNWWQSRTGWKRFADAWLVRLHTACAGPPAELPPPLSLAEFEQKVARIIRGEEP